MLNYRLRTNFRCRVDEPKIPVIRAATNLIKCQCLFFIFKRSTVSIRKPSGRFVSPVRITKRKAALVRVLEFYDIA